MKRSILTGGGTAAALLSIILTIAPAVAQNSHFVSASASVSNTTGVLAASFKIAGLGSNVTDTVTLSAQASAVYQCFNNGGNNPKAGNKETVTAPVTGSGMFTSGKNGTISDRLSVSPPSQGTFTCPSGQSLFLQSVNYTNVSLSDTAGATASIPGTFSASNLHIFIQ